MAHVILNHELSRLADGRTRIEVDASNVRRLVQALAARYPRLGEEIAAGMAVAIDGEIIHDPFLEALEPDSEVHFLPPIEGG